ncbi:cholinesterase-like [Dermacentor variabilis]|uniref:cholinesterase-like n=1 Tax=Dermacentor variabilis TaxID=34621 RepID=UPI003F5B13DB
MESSSESKANTVQSALRGKRHSDETAITTARGRGKSCKSCSSKTRCACLVPRLESGRDLVSAGSMPTVLSQEYYGTGASQHAVSSTSLPDISHDRSRRMSHTSAHDELAIFRWSARLKEALRLPLNVRLGLVSPSCTSVADKDGASEGRASLQASVQASARLTPDQIASAQMNSFWSMLVSHSRQLMPKGEPTWGHQLSTSDLACAVATILSAAIVILTSLLLLSPAVPADHAEVTVVGAFGSVTGFGSLAAGRHVYAFLGVPFAEPPLGKFRFQKAVPRQRSVMDGRRPGPACYQEGARSADVSEDCLHLNIWTPKADCDTARQPSCANRTVLFFLHGGFFQAGSNRDYPLDGSYLSALGDVVVVVPNYRLGALGFLYNGGPAAPGNAGLQDQLLALEWTRAHIGSFAGNGSDVVAMGHGAGAGSIGLHLFGSAADDSRHGSDDRRGLPRLTRAILMSGSPFSRMHDNTFNYHANVEWLEHHVHCDDNSATVKCLLDVDAQSMYSGVLLPRFFPSFTGLLPYSSIKQRHLVRLTGVNVLLGHMEEEVPYLVSYLQRKGVVEGPLFDSLVPGLLQNLGFNDSSSVVIAHYYTNGSAGNASRWAGELLADVLVVCPVHHFADYLGASGNNSVHRYLLLRRRRRPSTPTAQASLGARGTTPRLYALGLVFGDPLRRNNSDAEEQALSRRMIALWTEFAKSGTVPADLGENVFNYTIAISSAPNTKGSPFEFRKTQCDFLKDHYL